MRLVESLGSIALLVAATAAFSPEISPAVAGEAMASARGAAVSLPGPGAATTAQAGSIRGDVVLNIRAPRRSNRRYAGRAEAARAAQGVPAVAFLRGAISGTAYRSSSTPAMAQQDTSFAPSVLHVPVGGSVSFPNEDGFFHNVFSYSSTKRFDLGRYAQGETRDVTFDEAGIVGVFCEVHEFMRAAIIVSENPFHAVVGDDGSFQIDGVPPGEYTLVVWHVDLGEVEETVTVTDGGVASVSLELG